MADEPRQRRAIPRRASQDVVSEPEPAHTRDFGGPDADSASDIEREATELRSVTPAGRRRSRVLSPPASSELHWYNPLSKYWRHNVNITVPHDDCRDHLGKASVHRCACAWLRVIPIVLPCQRFLLLFTRPLT
jgi:hypothetical protein